MAIFKSLQMELTKKFQEAACSHAIRINSVELDRKYPIFQAERIVTKFGPTEKYLLTYLLTYSMEQSPSWEANWFCS